MARKKKNDVKGTIKEMEAKKRENLTENIEVVPNKVSFETWWFMRSRGIPARHSKEIILVDFKARGLTMDETLADFDAALEKYGVSLKW